MPIPINWGSLLSSVVTTIGSVVGSLIGSNSIEDGVVEFFHSVPSNGQEGFPSSICFEKGEYRLFNKSDNSDDILTMAFPERGDIGTETILVPGRSEFIITSFLKDNALHDNTQFELTACPTQQRADGQSSVTISASGKQIPTNGEKRDIGTYLAVQVEPNQITVFPKNGLQLQQVSLLSVKGSGDTGMRAMSVAGDPQIVTVQFPEPLQKDDLVEVEVIADVQQASLLQNIRTQKYAHLLHEVDEQTAARIRNAPRLNWGEKK